MPNVVELGLTLELSGNEELPLVMDKPAITRSARSSDKNHFAPTPDDTGPSVGPLKPNVPRPARLKMKAALPSLVMGRIMSFSSWANDVPAMPKMKANASATTAIFLEQRFINLYLQV